VRAAEWYIASGVAGLFAVCQSSEMYALSEDERLELAGYVAAQAAGRVPVIAVGNSDGGSIDEQAACCNRMAPLVDAVVILTCQLAQEHEPDDAWRANAEQLMAVRAAA
jgi:4-hydroxy-tetrahydrodipicolinate synthase